MGDPPHNSTARNLFQGNHPMVDTDIYTEMSATALVITRPNANLSKGPAISRGRIK